MYVDWKKVDELIDLGYINKQVHPVFPLSIYYYSHITQFEGNWNNETTKCRGLIADNNGNIISKPFPKFFNYSELKEKKFIFPDEPLKVTEKYDGSLGVSYFWEGNFYIATKGSFDSEQARKANELLSANTKKAMNPELTYLFEIIYPENRVVVDYKGWQGLIFLTALETDSGREIDTSLPDTEKAKEYDFTEIPTSLTKEWLNAEGFVVRYESGLRIKVKYEEYVRLHSIVTSLNKRDIWSLLVDEVKLEEVLKGVPDELYRNIENYLGELKSSYADIEKEALTILKKIEKMGLETQKDYALEILKYSRFSAILFAMVNKKSYEKLIWKMIKPRGEPLMSVKEEE